MPCRRVPSAGIRRSGSDSLARAGDERQVRLDADDPGAASGEPGEVEACAATDVEQVGSVERVQGVDRGVDDPGPVGREVLQLVDVRGVPDVRAADHDERRGFDALAGALAGLAGAFAGLAGALVALVALAGLAGGFDVAFFGEALAARVPLAGGTGWAGSLRPGQRRRGALAGHPGAPAADRAGRDRRRVHEQRDQLAGAGRAGPLDGVEVGLAAQHELGVARLAHQRGELGAVAAVDRLGARRAPRCSTSSTSRGRGRRAPSRGGRTRRSSPRGRRCRRAARRCGRTGGSAAASRRRAWPRAAGGR